MYYSEAFQPLENLPSLCGIKWFNLGIPKLRSFCIIAILLHPALSFIMEQKAFLKQRCYFRKPNKYEVYAIGVS